MPTPDPDPLRARFPAGAALRWFRAPGRVNLIGDHTDYNEGFCLPATIDREVLVAAAPRDDGRVRAESLELDGVAEVAADGSTDPAAVEPRWGGLLAAIVGELTARGRAVPGADLVVASTVPVGSGLSSSAAFEVAVMSALGALAGDPLPPHDLVFAAQASEHRATGVPSGVLDQMAAVHGRARHALLLDCRTLRTAPVDLPPLDILVVHSGLPRVLAFSEYGARRAACEAAAQRLGVAALRDATMEQVADDPIARHVVSENRRVIEFVDALWRDDLPTLGRLMLESHASLSDDYRVSTPELDLLVGLLVDHGAVGARLTGAGFGGCVVALTAPGDALGVAANALGPYRARSELVPNAFVATTVDGASEVTFDRGDRAS